VTGAHGELKENEEGGIKQKRFIHLYGNVIVEMVNRRYNVVFDDGIIREVASNTLHVEKASAVLPPEERPPPQRTSAAVSAIV
jgi:hypothetical protein